MNKEILYYTNNFVDNTIIFDQVIKTLNDSGLPIISCSLKPINVGKNIVLNLESGVVTMITQIHTLLKESKADYVFFCEHDVLYHKTHFDFTPPKDDIFYYNTNVWKWQYPEDRLITFDNLCSLSGICANRELLLKNYELRLKHIYDNGLDKIISKQPLWARQMGYEPGTKPIDKGGISNDIHEEWKSEYPNIDIRHNRTLTISGTNFDTFRSKPKNWKESNIDSISGWNLKELFYAKI